MNRVIQFPLVRLVIATVVVIATFFVLAPTIAGLPIVGTIDFLVIAAAVILVYVAYVRLVERRTVTELSISRAPAELGLGMLLGASWMAITVGTIWLLGGYEFTWNFVQGGIFGVTVSGTEANAGLLSAEPIGPVLLTGGEFGVEGSIVAIVLGLVFGVYFFVRAVQQGRIVQPFWQRRNIVIRNGEAFTQQV